MAPIGESCFLPPLDKCLDGRHQLFSWRTTFLGLSQRPDGINDEALQKHLKDAQSIQLLTRPFSPETPPTSNTKASFETRTSAINVSPSAHGRYDINQIKEDSLWLSKETKINEIAALRIAVLEWQTRPANRLLIFDASGDNHDYNNTLGVNRLKSSISALQSSFGGNQPPKEDEVKSFDDSRGRHQRLLQIYLSERRYLIKTCEFVIFVALFEALPQSSDKVAARSEGKWDRSGWLAEVGRHVLELWKLDERDGGRHFTVNAIEALCIRVQNLESGSDWLQDEPNRTQIEQTWGKNQLLEMIYIMQLLLTLLVFSTTLTRADTLLAWFRSMKKYGFFENFELAFVDPENTYNLPLQSLVALISLAALNLPAALEMIGQISPGSSPMGVSEDDAPYLLNIAGMSEINEILIDVAAACLTNSGPAVLAWGVILQMIRECSNALKESREVRQAVPVAGKYGVTGSAGTDQRERGSQQGGFSYPRRSSTSSETSLQLSFLEEVLDKVMDNTLAEDPVSYLAKSAVDGSRVLDVISTLAIDYCSIFGSDQQGKSGLTTRRMLLDLVRAVLDWIDYQPTLIHAVLAVLTGNLRYWDILDRSPGFKGAEPANLFLTDDTLMHKLFHVSLSRFPYESLPFLRICKALALPNGNSDEELPEIFAYMQNVNSFTSVMPPGFSAYEIIQEDEESNYIQLTGNLNLFDEDFRELPLKTAGSSLISRALTTSTPILDSQQLPRGTSGRVISETKPLVVMWHFKYSPLKYLGRILQSASANGSLASSNAAGSSEVVSEIIDFLSILLSPNDRYGSQGQERSQEAARLVLEIASDGLNRNQDIVSVIFQIFENELHRRQTVSDDESSFDLLLRCIQFMHALLSVMPDRVWPFLARSSLLGVGDVENQFNTIIGSSELIPGHHSFLLGCIRLFDALIEDATTRAVSQRVASTAVARFALASSQGSRVPRIMMERVLYSYLQMMMNMFESPQSWKLASQVERFEINYWLCSTFMKVLSNCHDIEDQADASQKIAAPLIPAADYLVNAFRSASNNSFKIHALLQMLLEVLASADSSLSIRETQYLTSQTVSALSFITSLIRVNRQLGHAPQRLEEHMFQACPILVKLYATHDEFRFPIVDLFEAIVSSAATMEQQPPSLLGHLGEVPARSFLEMLSIADQPFKNDDLSIGIWRFLSAIISRRQQWFAIFVLTGTTPRGSLQERKQNTHSSNKNSQSTEPLLSVALDKLSDLERLIPRVAVAMLEFTAHAADYWSWVLNTIEEHPQFLGAITEYIDFSGKNLSIWRVERRYPDYIVLRILSLVVNVLAMYVNHIQQVGDSTYAKKLIPNLRFLAEVAIALPSYNASLHGNLRRNFESKFPGTTLAQFKRSTYRRPVLGTSFYYNIELAAKVLSFDPAWAGRRGHGFADELLRANTNLSLVESQVNVLHSWKFLSVELGQSIGHDTAYQQVMITTVIGCLRSNVNSNLPGNIFQGLNMSRAELAFSLLQRLVEAKSSENDLKNVLSVAWDALRDHEGDVGLALFGTNADYYRILLKILSLSLQSYTLVTSSQSKEKVDSELEVADRSQKFLASTIATQVAVEIFGVVVARGFRSLTSLLHDNPSQLLPADFTLLIAISRAVLHMPGIGTHIAQLLSQFADHQTVLCASALLSWSDQIPTHRDPVYAELSISFLLSLSEIPPLAEALAVEGILTHLSSTNLVGQLRQKTGMGPFDTPTRLYSIWYRGILPLVLNLLTAVGAPIAPEIACTVNSFPAQLSRASNTFGSKPVSSHDPTAGSITLSMALEALNLAMILKILESFREAGPSVGVDADQIVDLLWDQSQVKDDIEHWMQRRAALRTRILPTNENEKAWARLPPLSTTIEAENRLEEKVLEQMKAILTLLGDSDQ